MSNPWQDNTARDIEIRPAENAIDVDDAMALVDHQTSRRAPDDRWRAEWGHGYPGFAPERTRMAYWRGSLAGALYIHSETMQIGEARLRTAALSWPTTGGRYREKGVGRSLLADAMRYVTEHRYHVALFFGEPHVHYPFGFAHCLPEYSIETSTYECLKRQNPYRARLGFPGDLPELQRLHNHNDVQVPCSLLRFRGHFARRSHMDARHHVLLDSRGRIGAYGILQMDGVALHVVESAVRDEAWCDSLLSHCGHVADEHSVEEIHVHAPPAHPIARHLKHVPSTHSTSVYTSPPRNPMRSTRIPSPVSRILK